MYNKIRSVFVKDTVASVISSFSSAISRLEEIERQKADEFAKLAEKAAKLIEESKAASKESNRAAAIRRNFNKLLDV